MTKRDELLPCAHCGGDNVELRECRLSPTMEREGALVSVQILHHCKKGSGIVSAMIEFRGRDRQSAIAAWNTRAQPAGGEAWRPIETAPKDGNRFLAYTISRGAFDPYPTYRIQTAKWSGSHWLSDTGDIVTDWQPLPAPPRAQAAQNLAEAIDHE